MEKALPRPGASERVSLSHLMIDRGPRSAQANRFTTTSNAEQPGPGKQPETVDTAGENQQAAVAERGSRGRPRSQSENKRRRKTVASTSLQAAEPDAGSIPADGNQVNTSHSSDTRDFPFHSSRSKKV